MLQVNVSMLPQLRPVIHVYIVISSSACHPAPRLTCRLHVSGWMRMITLPPLPNAHPTLSTISDVPSKRRLVLAISSTLLIVSSSLCIHFLGISAQ